MTSEPAAWDRRLGTRETIRRHFPARRVVLTALALVLVFALIAGWVLGRPVWIDAVVTMMAVLALVAAAWIAIRAEQTERANEQLRSSEARSRSLIENAADAILVFDAGGKLVDANHSALTLLGYPSDEIRTLRMVDLVPAEDLVTQPIRERELVSGQTIRHERRLKRKDGVIVPVEISARMLPDGHFQGNLRDISERLATQAAIQELNQNLEQRVAERTEQLSSEIAERERTQALLHAILDHSPAAIFVKRTTDWTYQVTSQASKSLFGGDLVGKTDFDVFADGPARSIRAIDESIIASGEAHVGDQHLTGPKGEPLHFLVVKFPLRDTIGSITGIGGVAVDITELKRVEAELRLLNTELEQRVAERTNELQLALRAGKLGTWVRDFATDRVVWSDHVEQIFGLAKGTFAGTTEAFLELVHPDDLEALTGSIEHAIESGEAFEDEHRIVLPNGEVRWLRGAGEVLIENGRPARMAGTVQDITDRRLAEERLRHSEHLLRETQQISHIGSWEWDVGTNTVTWSDEQFRVLGYEPHSVTPGKEAFVAAIHPDDREIASAAYSQSIETGTPSFREYRVVRPNREIRIVLAQSVVDQDQNGGPRRIYGSLMDITEGKRIEEALQRSLAEKEMLLREIHHRVKNNLQIVSGLLQFQSRNVRDPADLAAFVDGRNRLVAMTLVHEKLYRSKDLGQIDFGDYVRSLVGTLQQMSESGARRIHVAVEADAVQLPVEIALPSGMIVCELMTNVFKYAFPDERSGEARVAIRSAGNRVSITVRDSGVGLPAGFDPDQVTTFGWQLLQSLILQLDAHLEVVSNSGTSVTVTFAKPDAQHAISALRGVLATPA